MSGTVLNAGDLPRNEAGRILIPRHVCSDAGDVDYGDGIFKDITIK